MVPLDIENAVHNAEVVAVVVTVHAHQHAVRSFFVCLVYDIKHLFALLDTVRLALKALVADDETREGRGVDGLAKPPDLLGGHVIPRDRRRIGARGMTVF